MLKEKLSALMSEYLVLDSFFRKRKTISNANQHRDDLFNGFEQWVVDAIKNRELTIRWLWNKEKTDTDKLLMVRKQFTLLIKDITVGQSKSRKSTKHDS